MMVVKCPVCKSATGGYYAPAKEEGEVYHEYPLYQRSYKGEPEFISSRCSRCYDRARKREERRLKRRELTLEDIDEAIAQIKREGKDPLYCDEESK